ncbi:tetratricopeptide repeat protein [Plantactinospora sp. GCM10030261]|uniref:tetratricopeptide repeat protein n=1 Tax=Plantactinospora sp. GCM10030261 TaxID=3273420 RepID=UPI003608E569
MGEVVMDGDQRLARAQHRYERAVFGGDPTGLAEAERDLDGLAADVALAQGRIHHARFLDDRQPDPHELALFQQAADGYRALGDVRGEAESAFWIGAYHQVVAGDTDTGVPYFAQALELASKAGDRLTQSYALRHLGFAAQSAGRPDEARERMLESTRLRREIGFSAGVAANLVALAYLAADGDRGHEVPDILAEAAVLAEDAGAGGILTWIEEARTQLGVARPSATDHRHTAGEID